MTAELEEQVTEAVDSLVVLGVGLVEALVVIVVARYVHRFIRGWILRRLDTPNLSESGRTAAEVATTVVVGLASATVLLALWGVTWSGIVTAISVGTLGILLGVQDVLKSLIGGIFLIAEQPYRIGDRIQVRDITGRVIGIELRTTVIRSDEGHRIVAPNSIVFTDTMTNFSLRRQIRTNLVLTGIAGHPAELRTGIEEAVAGVEGVDGSVEVLVRKRRPPRMAPRRDRHATATAEREASPTETEVWVGWLGGGEPEVQSAVVARLRERHPALRVRSRQVRGTEVPNPSAAPQASAR